jgi:23S rRNA (pseudouridine1915-N3)-methyltransferase
MLDTMQVHIVTVGQPKLAYAKEGWEEYWHRLKHYHQLRVTHIADKQADISHINKAVAGSYVVALDIAGQQLSSHQLAAFLDKRSLVGKEISFVIGGPEGLPAEILQQADFRWSFGQLTHPHDLAMVMLLEALYRASTINAGQPYHK